MDVAHLILLILKGMDIPNSGQVFRKQPAAGVTVKKIPCSSSGATTLATSTHPFLTRSASVDYLITPPHLQQGSAIPSADPAYSQLDILVQQMQQMMIQMQATYGQTHPPPQSGIPSLMPSTTETEDPKRSLSEGTADLHPSIRRTTKGLMAKSETLNKSHYSFACKEGKPDSQQKSDAISNPESQATIRMKDVLR